PNPEYIPTSCEIRGLLGHSEARWCAISGSNEVSVVSARLRMYGRGKGLAEEAEHELELAHRNDPEFGNASAQGRADLFPARLCLSVFFGANPRSWGVAAVRSHNVPAHRSHYHVDRVGFFIRGGDEAFQRP